MGKRVLHGGADLRGGGGFSGPTKRDARGAWAVRQEQSARK